MYKLLIYHFFLKFLRNEKLRINILIKILICFSFVYFLISLTFFSLKFDDIIKLYIKSGNSLLTFSELLFYILAFKLIVSFISKDRLISFIYPYLSLPLKKSKIYFYIIIFKLVSFFNLSILCFVIPYAYDNILLTMGLIYFINFVLFIFLIVLIINYLSTIIRYSSRIKIRHSLIGFFSMAVIFIICFYMKLNLINIFNQIVIEIINGNHIYNLLLLITFIIILYILASRLDKLRYCIQQNINYHSINYNVIQKSNNYYIIFEYYLITRNNRIRGIGILPLFFIIFTYFVFYLSPLNNPVLLYFWYICLLGLWGYSYLQYIFAIERSFFSFIFSSGFDLYKYLVIKYETVVFCTIFIFILTLPLIIMKKLNLFIIFSALLYNIGVGFLMIMLTGISNRDKIDLSSSLLFNSQGQNYIQIISLFLIVILPVLFIITFSEYKTGLYILDLLCIVSVLKYNQWIKKISMILYKLKYVHLNVYHK